MANELDIVVEHYTTPEHLHKEYCGRNAENIDFCRIWNKPVCLHTCRYSALNDNIKSEMVRIPLEPETVGWLMSKGQAIDVEGFP